MKATVLATRVIFSLLGIALIVLGILFWTGRSLALVSLHMLLGVLFVLCMWLVSGLALYARAGKALALVVFVWGAIVAVFGVLQTALLPGPQHWLIRTAHLLVGLIAMGLGHALARRVLGSVVASPGRASA